MNWYKRDNTDFVTTVDEIHSASVTVAFPTWKVRVRVSFKVFVSAGNDRDYSYTITGWNSRDIQFRKQKVESGTKGIDKDSPAIPIVESIDFLGVYPIDRVKLDVSVHGKEGPGLHPDVETEIQFLDIVDVENSQAFTDNTLPTCNVTYHPAEEDPNGYPSVWFKLQDTPSGLDPEKIRYFTDNVSFGGANIPRGTRQPVTIKFYKNNLSRDSYVELWIRDLAGNGPTKCWLRNGHEGVW
jgi:hypothetical protein